MGFGDGDGQDKDNSEARAVPAAPADPPPQDKAAMRHKFIRYGVMILPDDPLHRDADPDNAIDGKMLSDALDINNVVDTEWNASTALTSVQRKRKRMIENDEFNEDEYIIGTVILAQEIKLAKQRRRTLQIETAKLQMRESAVLAYERLLAEDT